MTLNYGHTFGHALEAVSNYEVPHGEAVALGMICAARLARKKGMLGKKDEERQNRLIRKVGLPVKLDRGFSADRVIRPMLLDKKKKGGKLRFILPEAIGRVRIVDHISASEIKQAIQ